MKKILILLLLVCLSTTIIFSKPVNYDVYKDLVKKNVYMNKSLKFNLTFNDTWQIYAKYRKMPEFVKPIAQQIKQSGTELINFGLTNDNMLFIRGMVEEIAPDMDLSAQQYYDAVVKAFSASLVNYSEAEVKDLNGKEAAVWNYEIVQGEHTLKFHEYILRLDNKFLRVSFWSLASMYEDSVAAYEEVMNSIEFK